MAWRRLNPSFVRARPQARSSSERTTMLKGTDLTLTPLFDGLD